MLAAAVDPMSTDPFSPLPPDLNDDGFEPDLDDLAGPTDEELEEIEAGDDLDLEGLLEPEPGEDLVNVNIWPRVPSAAGRW